MFTTTPDIARRQDMRDIREIADYRVARAAAEHWRKGGKGIEELVKHPALGEMLVAMKRAELATDAVEIEHIYEAMRKMPVEDDDEDEY